MAATAHSLPDQYHLFRSRIYMLKDSIWHPNCQSPNNSPRSQFCHHDQAIIRQQQQQHSTRTNILDLANVTNGLLTELYILHNHVNMLQDTIEEQGHTLERQGWLLCQHGIGAAITSGAGTPLVEAHGGLRPVKQLEHCRAVPAIFVT